ncbi:MAG: PEP-CTERM sorting domain-containing protein [Verrucomicrobiota bacterium]
MKKIVLHKKRAAAAAIGVFIYCLSIDGQAIAAVYSVSFTGLTGPATVTGIAGVVPVGGWNNVDANNFTSGIIAADDLTTATLTISGEKGQWQSGGTTIDGGNGSLMHGYIDYTANGGGGSNVVSGLTGSLYTVYLYTYGDAPRPGNGGDLLPQYTVNGLNYYAPTLGNGTTTYNATNTLVGGAFGGFVQATTYSTNFNTQTALASDFGNYIRIDNVVPVNGEITIAGGADAASWRSPLNGFQIVSVPEPATYMLSTIALAVLGLVRTRNK